MLAVDILLETPESYIKVGQIMVQDPRPISMATMEPMEVHGSYHYGEMDTQISYDIVEYPIERFNHRACIVTTNREHAEKLSRG